MKTDMTRMHLGKKKSLSGHCKNDWKKIEFTSTELSFNSLTIYWEKSNWLLMALILNQPQRRLVWRCNIQTQEASHILLLSHSRAQHFLKKWPSAKLWLCMTNHPLFLSLCWNAVLLWGDFRVNKCVGIHFRKVKYPGDVLCCDYGNSCITNSARLLSLHSCCFSGHRQHIFLNQIIVHLLRHCYFLSHHSVTLERG